MSGEISHFYKYGVMAFTFIVLLAITITVVPLAFQQFGLIIGVMSLVAMVSIIFGLLMKFLTVGLPNYNFEETVANMGVKMMRQVILKDPKTGLEYFNEKGFLSPTQRGCFFFYGWPFLFAHNKLVINNLTSDEMAYNPIVIEGMYAVYPGELYIATEHEIKVKGSVSGWSELKAYEGATELVSNTGVLIRESIAASPAMKAKVGSDITVNDLIGTKV